MKARNYEKTFNLFNNYKFFAAGYGRRREKFNDNRASISVQKQPALENSQRQSVKNNWFCIIVQVNGKVLETLPQLQE